MSTVPLAYARAALDLEAARLEAAAQAAARSAEYADHFQAREDDLKTARACAGDASIIRAAIDVLARLERRS